MSKPIIVDSEIKLPRTDSDIDVSLTEEGAAHVGFGLNLYLGADLIRRVVTFPDEDDVDNPFPLDAAVTLRGMNIDCFGRVFSAIAENIELRLAFSAAGKVVARSKIARVPITSDDSSREFHLRCLFV